MQWEVVRVIEPQTVVQASSLLGCINSWLHQVFAQYANFLRCMSVFYWQLIFMYIDNQIYYGHLIDSENYDMTHKHSDLWEIFDNRYVCHLWIFLFISSQLAYQLQSLLKLITWKVKICLLILLKHCVKMEQSKHDCKGSN